MCDNLGAAWNVGAIGKVEAVRKKIASQFANEVCSGPEKTVMLAAAAAIDACLAAQDPSYIVRVHAQGKQHRWCLTPDLPSNDMSIRVEPEYGFVE